MPELPDSLNSLDAARLTTHTLRLRAEAAGLQVRPPPTPPTARSTSGTPARLVRVSTACQAAL